MDVKKYYSLLAICCQSYCSLMLLRTAQLWLINGIKMIIILSLLCNKIGQLHFFFGISLHYAAYHCQVQRNHLPFKLLHVVYYFKGQLFRLQCLWRHLANVWINPSVIMLYISRHKCIVFAAFIFVAKMVSVVGFIAVFCFIELFIVTYKMSSTYLFNWPFLGNQSQPELRQSRVSCHDHQPCMTSASQNNYGVTGGVSQKELFHFVGAGCFCPRFLSFKQQCGSTEGRVYRCCIGKKHCCSLHHKCNVIVRCNQQKPICTAQLYHPSV